VKTAKYQKRCFDQIQGISEDNKELMAEVDHLRKRLEIAEKDQTELESQRLNAILQLGQKERERAGNVSYPHTPKH
jgi:regulator of replication initiation timing